MSHILFCFASKVFVFMLNQAALQKKIGVCNQFIPAQTNTGWKPVVFLDV